MSACDSCRTTAKKNANYKIITGKFTSQGTRENIE